MAETRFRREKSSYYTAVKIKKQTESPEIGKKVTAEG